METITKKCTKCNLVKDISLFSRDNRIKCKVRSICKDCSKILKRQWDDNNRDKISSQCKKWKLDNKERQQQHLVNYKLSEKYRLTRKRNKTKWNNSEFGKASDKNTKHKRRTKLKEGDVTTQQLLELQKNAKNCYWCNESLKNKKVHIDHYNPLSKGGRHTISNLVVSCSLCNEKKSAKDPIQFANLIGRLL